MAGLLLTVIAILVIDHKAAQLYAPTLGLFTAALVVLTLDAYIYGNISGIAPQDGTTKEGCVRAWTQGLPANGLLASGALAMVCGIGWVLAAYIVRAEDKSAVRPLLYVGSVLIVVVMVVTNLLILQGGRRYIAFVEQQSTITGIGTYIVISTIASTAASLCFIASNTCRSRSVLRTNGPQVTIKSGGLSMPTISLMAFTLAGCIFVGYAVDTPTRQPGTVVTTLALTLEVFIPNIIAVMLAWYSPRLVHSEVAESTDKAKSGINS